MVARPRPYTCSAARLVSGRQMALTTVKTSVAFTHQGCCRLQQLEQHHRHETSSSVSLQAELQRIIDWMQKNDGASEQVAEVLGALQREQDDHRQAFCFELLTFYTQSTWSLVLVHAFAPHLMGVVMCLLPSMFQLPRFVSDVACLHISSLGHCSSFIVCGVVVDACNDLLSAHLSC